MVKSDKIKATDRIEKLILRSTMIVFNRAVKKLLTYEYLGIQSGMLRNQTNAIVKKKVLYFGTNPWYGIAYETGDWERWAKRPEPNEWKPRNRRANWRGDRKKRPFLIDTIESQINQKEITQRIKAGIKGIMGKSA